MELSFICNCIDKFIKWISYDGYGEIEEKMKKGVETEKGQVDFWRWVTAQ